MTTDLLTKLAEPFEPSAITWKPGASTKDGTKCMAMAYADLRAYQERLDAVCGLEWAVEYTPWGDRRIIARLTIAGMTRCSTGEMDAQDEKNNMGGTVAEAQAFKRAASMFGLGRYLYDLPSAWVEFDAAAKRISRAGEAELDKRYRDWYARKVAARNTARAAAAPRSAPPQPPQADVDMGMDGGNPFDGDTEPPTDEEHAIMENWGTFGDAYEWAIANGCENKFEAKNSMDKIVKAHGGYSKATRTAIMLAFIRRQREKQPVAA